VKVVFESDKSSSRASLAQLHVHAGEARESLALEPAFRPEIYEYTVSVDELVETVGVEAIAAQVCPAHGGPCSRPTTEVRAGRLDEPTPADFITLSLGRNTLHIVVDPGTELARTYVVHVHRAAPTDAALLKLEVDGVRFVEFWDSSRLEYSAMVPHTTESVTVHAQTRSAFASINGQRLGNHEASEEWKLHVGTNVLVLDVVAEDGQTHRQYSVTIEREGMANERALLEGARISPVGEGEVLSRVRRVSERAMHFEARVSSDVDAVTVTPDFSATAGDVGALRVNARSVREAAHEHWPLQPGRNLIQLLVWREGKESDKQLYTLLVTRDARQADGEDVRTQMSIPYSVSAAKGDKGSGAGGVLAIFAVLIVLAATAYLCIAKSTRVRLFLVDKLLPREGAGSLRSNLWQLAPFTKLDDEDSVEQQGPPSYPRSPRAGRTSDPWGAGDHGAGGEEERELRRTPATADGELEMGTRSASYLASTSVGAEDRTGGKRAPSAAAAGSSGVAERASKDSKGGEGEGRRVEEPAWVAQKQTNLHNPFIDEAPLGTGPAAAWHESARTRPQPGTAAESSLHLERQHRRDDSLGGAAPDIHSGNDVPDINGNDVTGADPGGASTSMSTPPYADFH